MNACFLVRKPDVLGLVAKDSSENETCWSIREHIISAILLHSELYVENSFVSPQLLVLSGLYVTHRQRLAPAKKTNSLRFSLPVWLYSKAYSESVSELAYRVSTIPFVAIRRPHHQPRRLTHLAEIRHNMNPRTSIQQPRLYEMKQIFTLSSRDQNPTLVILCPFYCICF